MFTAKALRDCERAAAAVEECLALLEAGPTALQLALKQVCGISLQEEDHEAGNSAWMIII
jgi:hypothetical protein